MARKMARKTRRKMGMKSLGEVTLTGVFDPPRKAIKLTRGHVTARDHKDLSTYEINCRIAAMRGQAEAHADEIERLSNALKNHRTQEKVLREDADALEQVVEGRR